MPALVRTAGVRRGTVVVVTTAARGALVLEVFPATSVLSVRGLAVLAAVKLPVLVDVVRHVRRQLCSQRPPHPRARPRRGSVAQGPAATAVGSRAARGTRAACVVVTAMTMTAAAGNEWS